MIFLILSFALASLCTEWDGPSHEGLLPQVVNESSGLAISKVFHDRLYHVNDSGDGAFFYITNYKGERLQKIFIEGHRSLDTEALSMAKYEGKSYLVIGDIGDNLKIRNDLHLLFIEEKEVYVGKAPVVHKVKISYPKGIKKNSEALAFHPNGNLYLITKEDSRRKNDKGIFKIYKIPPEVFTKKIRDYSLDLVAKLELPVLTGDSSRSARQVTAFDINDEGRWIILTYKGALLSKVPINETMPDTKRWKKNDDFVWIKMTELPQQEAIAFYPNSNDFLLTTEYVKSYGKAPLQRFTCAQVAMNEEAR